MLFNCEGLQKVNLRDQKTGRVLIASMSSMLNERRFAALTVDRLCREAGLSRATFYSHFMDKYDVLGFWLLSVWTCKTTRTDTYEEIREPINQFANKNKKIIKNLLIGADQQTLEIVLNFLCSALDIDCVKRADGEIAQKDVVAVNLYAGGIIYYLLWQAKNNFPPDVPVINEYSFGAIKKLWSLTKEQ